MFHESLVESTSLLRGRSRWPAVISFALWAALAAASFPVLGSIGAGAQVVVPPTAASGPVRVSSGVMLKHLLQQGQVVYPKIALLRRDQGTVVVEAVISKTGQIESARVVSGPEILQAAELQAVRASRYRPFLLDGLPVEVETTVHIGFSME